MRRRVWHDGLARDVGDDAKVAHRVLEVVLGRVPAVMLGLICESGMRLLPGVCQVGTVGDLVAVVGEPHRHRRTS